MYRAPSAEYLRAHAQITNDPIFILGLQRGGTNQLLNVLRSHPDTCWPHGELHEILRPRPVLAGDLRDNARRWLFYVPVLLGAGDVFSPHRPPPTGALEGRRGQRVKAELGRATRANARRVTAYKQGLARHGFLPLGQAASSRMLVKVVNYSVGLAAGLTQLYPEATFVGLIRDAIGVCEGRIARGGDLESATAAFNYVGEQFMALERAGAPFRAYRFEDLITDTMGIARDVYAFCGLDGTATLGLCLQDKRRVYDAAGAVVGMELAEAFYAFGDVGRHMRAAPNAGAAERLSADEQARIRETCRPVLEHYGYV